MRLIRIPVFTAVCVVVILLLGACSGHKSLTQHPGTVDSLANNAYDVIAGAKGYLEKEKSLHPECASASSAVCTKISQAIGAKDVLIDALSVYCSGPNFLNGGACDPPAAGTPAQTQAQQKLEAALASYNQIAEDLKKAAGGN